MPKFYLFDGVKLKVPMTSPIGNFIAANTSGTIVEILGDDEAYLVEFFGDWVKLDDSGNTIPTHLPDTNAFRETLDVLTIAPEQLILVQPAAETVGPRMLLATLLDEMPTSLVAEVADFAKFLLEKQRRASVAHS